MWVLTLENVNDLIWTVFFIKYWSQTNKWRDKDNHYHYNDNLWHLAQSRQFTKLFTKMQENNECNVELKTHD